MKFRLKIALNWLVYIIHLIILFAIAYAFNKLYQMIFFECLFLLFQNCFNYRFHSDSIINDPIKASKWCKIITCCVEIMYLTMVVSFRLSVYFNLGIIIIIVLINSLIQCYIVSKEKLSNTLTDKEQLILKCKDKGITNLATNRLILRYIEHKSIKEIAQLECVEQGSIAISLMRSRKKLKN